MSSGTPASLVSRTAARPVPFSKAVVASLVFHSAVIAAGFGIMGLRSETPQPAAFTVEIVTSAGMARGGGSAAGAAASQPSESDGATGESADRSARPRPATAGAPEPTAPHDATEGPGITMAALRLEAPPDASIDAPPEAPETEPPADATADAETREHAPDDPVALGPAPEVAMVPAEPVPTDSPQEARSVSGTVALLPPAPRKPAFRPPTSSREATPDRTGAPPRRHGEMHAKAPAAAAPSPAATPTRANGSRMPGIGSAAAVSAAGGGSGDRGGGPRFQLGASGNPAPAYPERARRRGQEGRVVVSVQVAATGEPLAARIARSSGYRLLDDAALRTIRRWRFRPLSALAPESVTTVTVPIAFRLTN